MKKYKDLCEYDFSDYVEEITGDALFKINGGAEVENSHEGVAGAKVGDTITRTDGTVVTLKQADIDYAQKQLGDTGNMSGGNASGGSSGTGQGVGGDLIYTSNTNDKNQNEYSGFICGYSYAYGKNDIYKPITKVNTGNKYVDTTIGILASTYNLIGQGLNVVSNGICAGIELTELVIDKLDDVIPSKLTASGSFKQDLNALAFIGITNPTLISSITYSGLESINQITLNIKQTENYISLKKAIDTLDVTTQANSAIFYSGVGNRTLAEEFALSNCKTTLEMTKGGSYLDGLKLFEFNSPISKKQAYKLWSKLSASYAQSSSGNVYCFVQGASETGIFNTVELPALVNNENVTNIFSELLK